MNFGNIGISGLLLVVIVLVLVFGPSKLPELGKAFGRSLKEFREATKGLRDDITGASSEEPRRSTAAADTSATPKVNAASTAEPIELREPKDS